MKLTQNTKRTAGLTLLELTVVILVLLSLIGILFFGAKAWKRGADRAASILVIRNTQQAVRSYSNMYGVDPGATVADLPDKLFGTGKFVASNPTDVTTPEDDASTPDIDESATATETGHPAGVDYKFAYVDGANNVPDIGALYIQTVANGDADDAEEFNPTEHSDW
ncbi:type II secretion system protein [Luteolibacter pohnpeiensis]|uniref:Type II secretion system protein n=1 Tax=Luteolibacter pohnpeiensis TaxID=454153 RepID=A0A934SC70_9BACT|nr:type II secretion system protein [Luteolibacter pohnpeiensis]MBK1882603.1 type II secretion system protein [Luteolibacter pohnpeiensis]